MSQGLLYFLVAGGRRGQRHAIHLRVSLMTLREHSWQGPVHVVAGDDSAADVCRQISEHYVRIRQETGSVPPFSWRRVKFDQDAERCYSAKARMCEWSPFDQTIYADCDTVFLGDINELWPKDDELVFTQFAGWTLGMKKMGGRIEKLRPYAPSLVNAALSKPQLPAINTGVVAWQGGAPNVAEFFRAWQEHCALSPHLFISDELYANALLARFACCRCVDGRYNASPIHGPFSDARIIHYHGGKAFSRDAGVKSFAGHIGRAMELDFAGIHVAMEASGATLAREEAA